MGVTEKETKNQVVAAFAILWLAKKDFLHQINFKQTTTKSTSTKKMWKIILKILFYSILECPSIKILQNVLRFKGTYSSISIHYKYIYSVNYNFIYF